MASTTRRTPTTKAGGRSSATMQRYMDAAEALYIRLGYEGMSIRAISARAKLNLATVVYHWGTKEALFRAICQRRFVAIHEEQLTRLRACADDDSVDLETVLRALVEPPLRTGGTARTAQTIRLLYGRVLTDPSPVVLRITVEMFADSSDLFRALIRKCLPHIDDDVFFWRCTCALGAFIFAQSFGHRIAYAADIDNRHSDWAVVTDEIVAFMAAGLLRR